MSTIFKLYPREGLECYFNLETGVSWCGSIGKGVFQMAYWKCPLCGFEAQNEEEKQKHMEEMKEDPSHMKKEGEHDHEHGEEHSH